MRLIELILVLEHFESGSPEDLPVVLLLFLFDHLCETFDETQVVMPQLLPGGYRGQLASDSKSGRVMIAIQFQGVLTVVRKSILRIHESSLFLLLGNAQCIKFYQRYIKHRSPII